MGITSWNDIIKQEQQKEYYKQLQIQLDNHYKTATIYPKKENIFKAFELCNYNDLKVVILGQDPYHQANQAQGLAFSTPKHIKTPPSMVNILKEITTDIGVSTCKDGDLTSWSTQGILLINTILTVEESNPKSHEKIGWTNFTDNIIEYISDNKKDIVFLLWGKNAMDKSMLIDQTTHHILTAPHPSPLSSYRGFFGCKHFSKTNTILKNLKINEINW